MNELIYDLLIEDKITAVIHYLSKYSYLADLIVCFGQVTLLYMNCVVRFFRLAALTIFFIIAYDETMKVY